MKQLKAIPTSELRADQPHAAFISEWGANQALAIHPEKSDPWWIWQTERDPNAHWAVVEIEVVA